MKSIVEQLHEVLNCELNLKGEEHSRAGRYCTDGIEQNMVADRIDIDNMEEIMETEHAGKPEKRINTDHGVRDDK